jgi:hypothetical protein
MRSWVPQSGLSSSSCLYFLLVFLSAPSSSCSSLLFSSGFVGVGRHLHVA